MTQCVGVGRVGGAKVDLKQTQDVSRANTEEDVSQHNSGSD